MTDQDHINDLNEHMPEGTKVRKTNPNEGSGGYEAFDEQSGEKDGSLDARAHMSRASALASRK